MIIGLFILISICLILYILKYEIIIHTSTMATIMAFGIVIYGVLNHFLSAHYFDTILFDFVLSIVLALWIGFWSSIGLSVIKGHWKSLHYSNLINRFGIGTWIAATSICGILIVHYIPQLSPLAEPLALANACLWLFYCFVGIQALKEILLKQTNMKVHGILLLTTVSTQSLILLFHTVFTNIPKVLTVTLLTIGFCFYFVSAFLIVKRYVKETWSIATDWNNTNCILHGALSISGVASITSGILSNQSLFLLWGCTAVIFIIVEVIEICRLFQRMKQFGFKGALGNYDVSQWSRIFTFAMFYTFTASFQVQNAFIKTSQLFVRQTGVWVILTLILFEIALVIRYLVKSKEAKEPVQKTA